MDKTTGLDIYRAAYASRLVDDAEMGLVRAGLSAFYVPCAGHEAMAALPQILGASDWLHCHYRDRAVVIARGVGLDTFFLDALSKTTAKAGGRRMPGFPCERRLNILSTPTVVGNNGVQAVGVAQVVRDQPTNPVVYCGVGDGSTQQGEFFEAVAEAVRHAVPVLFVVQDNQFALSTPTAGKTFYSLPTGDAEDFLGLPIIRLDGTDVPAVHDTLADVVDRMRQDRRPALVLLTVERLRSHTSSDDHTVYREARDLDHATAACDPLKNLREWLSTAGATEDELTAVEAEVQAEVDAALAAAKAAAPAEPDTCLDVAPPLPGDVDREYRGDAGDVTMLEAMRGVLHRQLAEHPDVSVFGEDLEDPKGDVFGLSRGLSTDFPGRVTNTALAEATIVGTAIGRAVAGARPVACLQFADFLPVAYNQIASEMATMYWRTKGDWTAAAVVMAPCGGYRPGLGPFHAQTPSTAMAHIPGLDVCIPATAGDAAGLLRAAIESDRPTLLFYPKSLLNDRHVGTTDDLDSHYVPIGKARVVQTGRDLTLVTWGSTLPVCREAAAALAENDFTVELIDLRTVSPWDRDAVIASANKTKRVLVVHEDNEGAGIGGDMVATVLDACGQDVKASRLGRADTHIPYDYRSQLAILPSVKSVVDTAAELLDCEVAWEPAVAEEGGYLIINAIGPSPSDRNITIQEFLVAVGDVVEAEAPLAAVEADKTSMDLASPAAGEVAEFLAAVGDTLDVGTPLIRLKLAEGETARQIAADDPGKPVLTRRVVVEAAGEAATRSPAFISSICAVTGSRARSNDELIAECPGWTSEDILRRTGIRSRFWLGEDEDVLSLAVDASRALLDAEGLTLSDLDAIVCSTGTPGFMTPSLACRVLRSLATGDDKKHIQAHDVNAACSGYLYALQQCYDIIAGGRAEKILLVTAETLSRLLDADDPETYFLFGDAATATLICSEQRRGNINAELHRPVLSALGVDDQVLFVPAIGTGDHVEMDGRPVFRLAVQQMLAMMRQACAPEGLEVEDLSVVVPHQANARIIEAIRKNQHLPKVKVFNEIENYGNTSSNTIPISLVSLFAAGGERVAGPIGLTAFGGGFTFGAAVLFPQG